MNLPQIEYQLSFKEFLYSILNVLEAVDIRAAFDWAANGDCWAKEIGEKTVTWNWFYIIMRDKWQIIGSNEVRIHKFNKTYIFV